MRRFNDKVTVITGAGSGIGRAAAILFAREGAIVIVIEKVEKSGNETANKINKIGERSLFIKTDVARSIEVKKAINTIVDKYQRIDVLFNNAGIALLSPLTDTSEREWKRIMDVNVNSFFLMSKYTLPHMIREKKGVIINTSSIAGLLAWPNESIYCTSKGGVIQLTKQMAVEFGRHNIRVNCVCPGSTVTPMLEGLFSSREKPGDARKLEARMHPLGRLAVPEEIAHTVLFLASDEAS
jgi:NAD(P)-dependent dehydrogenase (short-subunit alcohol dehydrogenase family)